MGKYPVVVSLILGLVIGVAGCSDSSASSGADSASPEFATSGGESLSWPSLRGQWVLVNYWAEWCKPCLEEIPELGQVDRLDDVTVLAVNFDGVTGDELAALGERMGIDFTMLAEDPAPALGWEVPGGLPATFVVAPDGTLKDTLMGAQTEADLMAAIGHD